MEACPLRVSAGGFGSPLVLQENEHLSDNYNGPAEIHCKATCTVRGKLDAAQ